MHDRDRSADADGIGDFLASHGGPFFELQRRLNLLRDSALQVGRRAAVFVALAWGVPLLLSLLEGRAMGPGESGPYLLDPGVWARFVVGTALFVLSERAVEENLRSKLGQFVRAPLIEPSAFARAAAAVALALGQRNSRMAELLCFAIALLASIVGYVRYTGYEATGWATQLSGAGRSLTLAGWWALLVSSPLFTFLLVRGLWRHLVWSLLLRRLAALDLRLVANHPDGKGGLGFIADYPNAYAMFVLGVSSAIAVALAQTVFETGITSQVFTGVLAVWLALVLALFAFPLQAFSAPLSVLKQQSLQLYGAQATRHSRQGERALLGRNVFIGADQADEDTEMADPSKHFAAAAKLSTILVSRSALVPVTAAALVPFAIVGAAQLPVKEVFAVLKKLIL
jgi:hypothetical protein